MSLRRVLDVRSAGRSSLELTARVQAVVRDSGVQEGSCELFVHHTSASLMLYGTLVEHTMLTTNNFYLFISAAINHTGIVVAIPMRVASPFKKLFGSMFVLSRCDPSLPAGLTTTPSKMSMRRLKKQTVLRAHDCDFGIDSAVFDPGVIVLVTVHSPGTFYELLLT